MMWFGSLVVLIIRCSCYHTWMSVDSVEHRGLPTSFCVTVSSAWEEASGAAELLSSYF